MDRAPYLQLYSDFGSVAVRLHEQAATLTDEQRAHLAVLLAIADEALAPPPPAPPVVDQAEPSSDDEDDDDLAGDEDVPAASFGYYRLIFSYSQEPRVIHLDGAWEECEYDHSRYLTMLTFDTAEEARDHFLYSPLLQMEVQRRRLWPSMYREP